MASAFTLIEDTVLGSAAASITFGTGLTDYTKFRLTLYAIKDGSAGAIFLRLNGDTGSNYAGQNLNTNNTTNTGSRVTGVTSLRVAESLTLDANSTALLTVEISKPLTTTPARATSMLAGIDTAIELNNSVAEWNNTADLISSISIISNTANFAANTRAVLEGAA